MRKYKDDQYFFEDLEYLRSHQICKEFDTLYRVTKQTEYGVMPTPDPAKSLLERCCFRIEKWIRDILCVRVYVYSGTIDLENSERDLCIF